MTRKEKEISLKGLVYLIALILTVLLWFIGINEFTLQTGKDIYLKTTPVDPRDPLRGDYVILRYEFESDKKLINYIKENDITNEDIYVSFISDKDNNWIIKSVSKTKPDDWIYISLKVSQNTWWSMSYETWIWKFFVPEWTGRRIERVRGNLIVHAKIDILWNAKIVDLYYKWEKVNPKTFDPN
jgi:uncharacterized membrane-anchored protein